MEITECIETSACVNKNIRYLLYNIIQGEIENTVIQIHNGDERITVIAATLNTLHGTANI